MPDALVYTLILLALVLPVPGALLLRLLAGRIGDRGVALGAVVIFGLAIASALALSRGDVGALRVGDITLLLPGTRASDDFAAPPAELPADQPAETLPGEEPPAPPGPADAPAASPTARPSATARPSPTGAPSATPEPPTATPEPPTATPEPPTATPEPPPAAAPRTYTVQPGDTLRSIAEQFGVSVQAILDANDLTPAEADALRVGQELIIP